MTTPTASAGRNSNKRILILLLPWAFLLVTSLLVFSSSLRHLLEKAERHSQSHPLIEASCSNTFHPKLCRSALEYHYSSRAQVPTSENEVVQALLHQTKKIVKSNYITIKKLSQLRINSRRGKTALDDCIELIQETAEEIEEVVRELKLYPSGAALMQHADDLKTLMSSAMTNQDTCLDGFSHDKNDKKIRSGLISGQLRVKRLCGSALAIITKITNSAPMENQKTERRLNEEAEQWPEWLSLGDRKLLQSATILNPNATVAADGSGDYTTVSAAVAAAPSRSTARYVIRIRAGVYRENVDVPSSKRNIMFVGDSRLTTIITGRRNVVEGSTTFNSATVGNQL